MLEQRGTKKGQSGQYRVGKKGERTDLLPKAATQLSGNAQTGGKEAAEKLGKCAIMVRGFLTYRGTLFVPKF